MPLQARETSSATNGTSTINLQEKRGPVVEPHLFAQRFRGCLLPLNATVKDKRTREFLFKEADRRLGKNRATSSPLSLQPESPVAGEVVNYNATSARGQ